jgi:hypothetical protein
VRYRQVDGTVHSQLFEEGWDATLGHPAIVPDVNGPAVDVQLFESSDHLDHRTQLDELEASGCLRMTTVVNKPDGNLSASTYALVPG